MITALTAMRRLYAGAAPAVSPVNSGMSETGSTTTKNTTKNFKGCSSIGAVRKSATRRAARGGHIIFLKASQARRSQYLS